MNAFFCQVHIIHILKGLTCTTNSPSPLPHRPSNAQVFNFKYGFIRCLMIKYNIFINQLCSYYFLKHYKYHSCGDVVISKDVSTFLLKAYRRANTCRSLLLCFTTLQISILISRLSSIFC